MNNERVLITSALLYANGPLHFGHIAGAYLPADCYARFERMQGKEVLYISGSDEYGVAITLSAELENTTPKEHVDKYHAINQAIFKKLGIEFDHYSRTTSAQHPPVVHAFFKDLNDSGYIQQRECEQLYSESDDRFLADRYVVGTCPRCGFEEARGDECGRCGASYEATDLKKPRSKLTGASLSRRKTRHWFLLFDRFKEKLETFLSARKWKPNVINFARQYVDELLPRGITRDLEWGVSVPLEEALDKVLYVWFDAPIGYISATQEWAEQKGTPSAWEEFWLNPQTRYVQFIGKDNIPFHAVFFPAMIMGQSRPYKLVDDLVANEFYNLEGKKFSKSEGWTIDLQLFFEHFTADQIRYTIAASAPETSDAEFTWKDFQGRCNGDLVGKLGNFINRTLVFIQNRFDSMMPKKGTLEESDSEFAKKMDELCEEIKTSFSSYRLRKSTSILMELAQESNAYFDHKAPWKDAKDPKYRARLETTLALCLEAAKRLAIISTPLIPEASQKIWQLLGQTGEISQVLWDKAIATPLSAMSLPKPQLIFRKIEDEEINEQTKKLQQMHEAACAVKKPPYNPLKDQIDFNDFEKLDLRVATILDAEKVPKSKKLLKLTVDIGLEKRTVVSGISHHYSPEELIGKKVVVVANLKPATLMGIESQGMVLAANLEQTLELVTLDDLPGGTVVN